MPDDAAGGRTASRPQRPAAPAAAAEHAAAGCRLFLAVWPAVAERDALLHRQQQWSWPPGAAAIAGERLHLTLHFLGSLPRQRLAELGNGLQVAFEPFELVLDRAEIWPNGLVVLRSGSPAAALQALHGRLGDALRSLGLIPERRRFRPHVTLARRAAGSIPPVAAAEVRWQVNSYALVESLASGAGGYLVHRRYGCGHRAAPGGDDAFLTNGETRPNAELSPPLRDASG
ncbi:RNA 2',3'-cyclic phosphodiesterase [Accumulibacter sp.]|uniref:RNA 2',3'-cyclic phosphodiesterase n=1 Tax=Accumulibacter sp. TaxID=2053492 RepID=UPI0025D2B88F|nr:RNA 2',3'-cyclic phosphodiesterase [Accumulibacter sp.]MCM8613505.1 RNA 2',3'-cyclic phosphodiesterase [Accumulibacter sp.]MCM8637180.1 RNA 2',3'-cyclic phosphodiesterase [Accumulibacter sp.]MCM8640756.1 RNA 2',3'-cyclic phosphodiesterase [Accumulibacter sp.]